ncbi:MAG TPA: HEAT repeat domain-containing protein [Acidobacteriaceae bacterium]|nr:HEAT repeat domain-containing protein [Acidobacteriaceae bacterium]
MKLLEISSRARLSSAALLFALLCAHPALAQNGTQPAAPAAAPAAQPASAPPADVTPPAPVIDRSHRTVAQNTTEAWNMLNIAAAEPHHADTRAQAVAAIGTIQGSRLTHKPLAAALDDSDLDVRTAAILAAGATKDKGLYGKLRQMLDDKEPQIVFTAAITLWKLKDKSGEDVLMAVIDGDRKTNAGLLKGSERTADKELHSPTKMAEFGARQGISIFGGPAGYGLTAWDYTHPHPGGTDPRITALNLLAQEKTANVHDSLLAALKDKDPDIRSAAACALGEYRDKATAINLLTTFGDGKTNVRLIGAAAYIRATGSGPLLHHGAAKI